MQLEILNSEHEKLLKKEFNMTLDDFKSLPFAEMDKMVDDTIMWIECDENSPDRRIASDIINSIYGPYNAAEVNADDDDE